MECSVKCYEMYYLLLQLLWNLGLIFFNFLESQTLPARWQPFPADQNSCNYIFELMKTMKAL